MTTKPLHVYSGGFLANARHRRILELAGWQVRTGWPGRDGTVAIWGRRPVSWRGRMMAQASGAKLLTVEDGFLRSVHPGVTGDQTLSLCLDNLGIYFDTSKPSRLEALIIGGTTEIERARQGIALLRQTGLSKYTPVQRGQAALPEPGYVLVIDQTRGDASIMGAQAEPESFARMIAAARAENPGKRVVVRSHPDTRSGRKSGHFAQGDLEAGDVLLDQCANPWDVLEGATRVYCVSSQLGFEALMAGKPVTCFGASFYSGWGLTDDRVPVARPRPERRLEDVFAAAYFDHSVYYDPFNDQLIPFEAAVAQMEDLARRQSLAPDHDLLVLCGFRNWKRRHSIRFGKRYGAPPAFAASPEDAIHKALIQNGKIWFWASKSPDDALERAQASGITAVKVEDGFLRSVGLGAELIAPASLVFDDLGIYYDPTRPSRVESLIAEAAKLPPDHPDLVRARSLAQTIVRDGITKYNTGDPDPFVPDPERPIVLVPGQVEDDASIRLGAVGISTNLGLLEAARAANPDAQIIYKPHPDVEAGLRAGRIAPETLAGLADHVAVHAAVTPLIDIADSVWTMTSLMGFEALLRGKSVTCLGLPFYAGWGLTQDYAVCERRTAQPSLDAMVWAALIAYPRYVDPVTLLPCPPERVISRLAERRVGRTPRSREMLAKAQGWFAGRGLIFWR